VRKPLLTFFIVLGSLLTIGCGVSIAGIIGGAFVPVGNDTAARYFHAAGALSDGRVMVTGGLGFQVFPPSLFSRNDISFFDPATNTFTSTFAPTGGGAPTTPMLSVARSSHTQTTLPSGKVLITGGDVGASGTTPGAATNTVEVFAPQTGLVSTGPAMASARAAHTATTLSDGRVVVAGGGTWQVFDPRSMSWSANFVLQVSRASHAAVLLPDHAGPGADRVLLIGGGGRAGHTMELLAPDAGSSWMMQSVLTVGVDDLGAVRLDDGTVLIVGGQDVSTGDTVGLSYRYDPVQDAIIGTPPPPGLPQGVSDHVLIAAGRYAFLFGGEQQVMGTDTELDVAAVYDRAADDWVLAFAMNQVRDDAVGVRLADGRVLLVGGGMPLFGVAVPTNTAEVFLPETVLPGDVNGDAVLDAADVLPLAAVLVEPEAASEAARCGADVNEDARLDGWDVAAMVARLLMR